MKYKETTLITMSNLKDILDQLKFWADSGDSEEEILRKAYVELGQVRTMIDGFRSELPAVNTRAPEDFIREEQETDLQ